MRQFRAIAAALNVAPSFLLADSTDIVLVPSGRERHYYVFRSGKLVGEWTGEVENVFHGGAVADPTAADVLIASIDATAKSGRGGQSSAASRDRDDDKPDAGGGSREGSGRSDGASGRHRREGRGRRGKGGGRKR